MSEFGELADEWRRDDPELSPDEKETTIRWARAEDEAVVHTDEAGLGRRLIHHADSTIESVNVLRGDGTRATVSPEGVGDDDEVVGVRVRLPVAAVSIKGSPRSSSQHAAVVSDAVIRTDGGVDTRTGDGERRLIAVCPDCDTSRYLRERKTKTPTWVCWGCGEEFEEIEHRPPKKENNAPGCESARKLLDLDPDEVP